MFNKNIFAILTVFITILSFIVSPVANAVEETQDKTPLTGIFDDGDVFRLNMKDQCYNTEGKKVVLKTRKKTMATFGEDGSAIVTNKNNDPIGMLNLDTNGSLVTGKKLINLEKKGKNKGDYLCIGTMFGKVKKAETKDGHKKNLKGFDTECCWSTDSQIVLNYQKRVAEEDRVAAESQACEDSYEACRNENECCKDDGTKDCEACEYTYEACLDKIDEAIICDTTEKESNVQDCSEICDDCDSDCLEKCEDDNAKKKAKLKYDRLVCKGKIKKLCKKHMEGDLSNVDDSFLACKSKWSLKYRNRFQTTDIKEDKK